MTKTPARKLRFESIADCMAEVHRIEAADGKGKLRTTGSWTPGQNMAHVAAWIEYGFEGYPMRRPPFFIRWFLVYKLPRMLDKGMRPGVRIPGVQGGTFGADPMPTPQAAQRLLAALKRLQDREEARFDSPAFGAMSYNDRIRLNLRHAELHLGFIEYD